MGEDAAQGAAKRMRLAVEPGALRAPVQAINADGLPELMPAVTREARFDAWLAKQPVPWSVEAARKQAAGAAEPAEAPAADDQPADEPAEKFKDQRDAQAHLVAAYEEMKKLSWALQLFKEKKMDVALVDTKQDAQPPTEGELVAEAQDRISEKQQHLRGAASRLRERAATLRASVKQGRAYHRELAKLNRAWRVTSAAAAKEESRAALQNRDTAAGQRHVVDCFMPNCIGAGHGGDSYISLRKREDGGVGVVSQSSCCHISVTDVKTSSKEEGEVDRSGGSDTGAASCHQLLRYSQRGRQNQLLADLLVREAKAMAVPGRSTAGHRVQVVVDPSRLHLEYLPGRALRFGLHREPMPKPAAVQASDVGETEGAAATRAGASMEETAMGLLTRSLVLSTAGVSATAPSAKTDILAQLIAAARFRASRESVFALLDTLIEEQQCRQVDNMQHQRPAAVHWLPSSAPGTVIELCLPTRGKLRLVLPPTGSGLVRVSSLGTARPRSTEVHMAQLAEFLKVEMSRDYTVQ